MTPLISVVIPSRPSEPVGATVDTLLAQTIKDLEIHIVVDELLRGAPWARNRGMVLARGEYVLFCDNDVFWNDPRALERLVLALAGSPEAAFAYCGYEIPGVGIYGLEAWDVGTLRHHNFISTMSLFRISTWRRERLCWDESLYRLQDWDVALTFAERGYHGVQVPSVLFTTPKREGLTFGKDAFPIAAAESIVRRKHGL